MQKERNPNLTKRIAFRAVAATCGVLAALLLVHIVMSYKSGVASAYVGTRASTVLKVAPRASLPSEFWFYIGAWGLGALLLLYLAVRFIQASNRITTVRAHAVRRNRG